MSMYYVWPCGTVQDTSEEGVDPYSYMSDDFYSVMADDEEQALKRVEMTIQEEENE